MATRIRDENALRPAHPGYQRKVLKKGNENLSITRPTLASSAKAKPELKSKVSRTVLAPLSKAANTPRVRSDGHEKPKVLTTKLGQSLKSSNPVQTPRPSKKLIPKSAKKAINVYTPARPSSPTSSLHKKAGVAEVEFSHPKPPGLEDGPPTPIRNAFFAASRLKGDTDQDDELEFEPPTWSEDLDLMLADPTTPPRPL